MTGQLTALIGAGVIFALAGYHWMAAIVATALIVITVLSGWLPE